MITVANCLRAASSFDWINTHLISVMQTSVHCIYTQISIWSIVLMFHLTLTRPEGLQHTRYLCGWAVKPGLIKFNVIRYIYFTWKTPTIKHNKQQQMRWIGHKGWKLTNSLENLPVSHNFFINKDLQGPGVWLHFVVNIVFPSAAFSSSVPKSLISFKLTGWFEMVHYVWYSEALKRVHPSGLSLAQAHIHTLHQNIHQDHNKMSEINLLQMGTEQIYR